MGASQPRLGPGDVRRWWTKKTKKRTCSTKRTSSTPSPPRARPWAISRWTRPASWLYSTPARTRTSTAGAIKALSSTGRLSARRRPRTTTRYGSPTGPARGFRGEPGIERFTVDKAGGTIALRQIVSEPAGKPRPRLLYALVGLIGLVVVGAVVGVLFATGILPPEAETTEAPPPAAVPTSTTVTVPVAPNEPAVLVSPQGEVTVRLAAGSVEDPVDLSYTKVGPQQVPAIPAGFVLSDKVFDLSVSRAPQAGSVPVKLAKPITITVRLSADDATRADGDESNIVIQHFIAADARWDPLPTAVDFSTSVATAEVDSLSIFALTIREVEATPTPDPTVTATPTVLPIAAPAPPPTETPAPTQPPVATATTVPTATKPPAQLPTATPTTRPTATPTPTPSPVPIATPTATPPPRRLTHPRSHRRRRSLSHPRLSPRTSSRSPQRAGMAPWCSRRSRPASWS